MVYRTWNQIYGFWKIFIREIYIECLSKEMTLIWPSNSICPPFFNSYCYYDYTAKHAADNTTYLKLLNGPGINITDK